VPLRLMVGNESARSSWRMPWARTISCSATIEVTLRTTARRTASSMESFSCANAGAASRNNAAASSRRMRDFLFVFSEVRPAPPIGDRVQRGHEEQGEEGGDGEPADDGARQRQVGLAA